MIWQEWLKTLSGPLLTVIVLSFWHYTDNARADIREVREEVRADIREIREEMRANMQEVRTEVQEVREEVRTLNKLLTDNLSALNRDLGKLQGASHLHIP